MTHPLEKTLIIREADHGDAGPLFEAHPAPSLLFTRAGVITHANSAMCGLLRADSAALVNASVMEFFPEVAAQLAQMRGPVCQRRVAVRRTDGSNFIARVSGVPIGVGPGSALLASIEDLTEFEAEVAAADKEFDTLTSATGHDLRGPLRILKGFAEALEDECGAAITDEGRNFLAEILKAGDRMEGLIDGLLAYSRAGRAEVNCESLDLTTLVELVYYEFRHAKNAREVDARVDPAINTWGDVRLMMTILRNLIGNAWKFTSRTAEPAIRFYTEQRDGHTWICVTDNGAGFDAATAERLFKPFTRLHRQDEFPGAGLGLATVHRIVKRHGGDIEAEAEVGKGATLRFWLPHAPE